MNLKSFTRGIIIFILQACAGTTYAQVNFHSVADTVVNTIPPAKCFFVGQAHNNKANLPLEQELLFSLNRKYGLRYDILEYGHSTAIILNEYLRTDADSLLILIHPEAGFNFIRTIKKFNDTVPGNRKIFFYGIDFEGRYEYMHLKKAIEIVVHKSRLHDTTTLKSILNRIRNGSKQIITSYIKELKNYLAGNEITCRELLGTCYIDLLLMANAQQDFSPARDGAMYDNFTRLYRELIKTDSNVLFLSSFGYAHVNPSNTKSITNRLRKANDSPVRDKVALIGIEYYQSSFHDNEIKKWTGNLSFLCSKRSLERFAVDANPRLYFFSQPGLASLSCNPDISNLDAVIIISNMGSTQYHTWE